MTSREAAAYLGVSTQTLYTYVSRGLLRSLPSMEGTSKNKKYVYDEVRRLRTRCDARRGHGAVAEAALEYGHPIVDTRVSAIDHDGPRYRGCSAVELAKLGMSFESVAELLWAGSLPESTADWSSPTTVKSSVTSLYKLLHMLHFDRSRAVTPIMQFQLAAMLCADIDAGPLDAVESTLRAARTLIRLCAALPNAHEGSLHLPRAPETSGVAQTLWVSLCPTRKEPGHDQGLAALNQALILAADHELDTCTFAARVAASMGCNLYTCVGAGLSGLGGAKAGDVCDRIEAVLETLDGPEDAARWVAHAARDNQALPAFGHALYPKGDPRASPLLAAARKLSPDNRRLRALRVLVDAQHARPNLEIGLVAVCTALEMPRGSALAIFALGRVAGLVAHVLEEWARDRPIRPRARYVGR